LTIGKSKISEKIVHLWRRNLSLVAVKGSIRIWINFPENFLSSINADELQKFLMTILVMDITVKINNKNWKNELIHNQRNQGNSIEKEISIKQKKYFPEEQLE
jgi:hypothetical protein